jgi:hypothetical protein
MASFIRNDIRIHYIRFIEDEQALVVVAPRESQPFECLYLERKTALQYLSVSPEEDLVCTAGDAEAVLLSTPFCLTDLRTQGNHSLYFEG